MGEPIRSIKDPLVIAARKSLGHFRPAETTASLIEGAGLVLQALEAQAPIGALFYLQPTQIADEERALRLAREAGIACHSVTRGVFSRVLGLSYETATRLLATVRIAPLSLSQMVGRAVGSGRLLIGEGIQDPRNTGALIRTAEAWGLGLVAFTVGSASPYSRASVRSSTGSIFRVAVSTGSTTADLLSAVKAAGIRVIGTSAGAQIPLWRADMSPPCAVLLGNETLGLSQEARELSDVVVRIPMLGAAHSFNVTVAAGIVLYEAARQRAI